MLVEGIVLPTATNPTWGAFTHTGATVTNPTLVASATSTLQRDIGGRTQYAPVTGAGTITNVTSTLSGTTTAAYGAMGLVRLRETTPAVPGTPAAPTLDAKARSVRVTWTATTDTTSYTVQRSPAGGGSWSSLKTGLPGLMFVDGTAAPSTSYDYRIVAVGPGGSANGTLANTTTPAAAAGTSTYATLLQDHHLEVYLRLGDVTTTAVDLSGNARDGTYSGSYTQGAAGITGDGDTATTFTNTSAGTVSVPHNDAFQLNAAASAQWSLVFGVRINTAGAGTFPPIMGKGAEGGDGWLIYLNGTDQAMQFKSNNVSTSGGAAVNSAPVATLMHFVITYDGTTIRFYRDGAEIGSGSSMGSFAQAMANTSPLALNRNGSGSSYGISNLLDEVALLAHPLSATEVSDLYAALGNSGGGGTAHTVTIDDTVGLTDDRAFTRGLAVTDTVGLADTRALSRDVSLTDLVGLVDTRAISRDLVLDDTVGLTDDPTPVVGVGGVAHTVTIDDSVGLVDARTFSRDVSLTDTVGLADTRVFGRTVTVTDTVGLTDSRVFTRTLTVTDLVGLADSQAFGRSLVITDLVGLADTRTVGSTAPVAWTVTIDDTVGLVDSTTIDHTVAAAVVYIFRTPVLGGSALTRDALPREQSLMRHYGGYPKRGVAVIIWPDLTVEERRVLRGDEHLTARNIFLGGHENVVDAATAAILDEAGYELVGV
jgi:hypothetical protein